VTITGYSVPANGPVLIPGTIDGLPVTAIGIGAFQNNVTLTQVSIPNSVVRISQFAFSGCSTLNSVNIPDGVTSIARSTFEFCPALTQVTIPSNVTAIGTNAFKNCTALTSLTIPGKVSLIGIGAFANCAGLTSLTFLPPPPGHTAFLTTINSGTFSSCSSLTSLVLPSTITVIGNFAFQYCEGLTSLAIPASVTSIGPDFVFDSCSRLSSIIVHPNNPTFSTIDGFLTNKLQTTLITCPAGKSGTVTIPSTITAINPSAFLNCSKIVSVVFPQSVTDVGSKAFSTCSQLRRAIFLGDSPSNFITDAFEFAASGFTVYFYEGAAGFTSPTWNGYPAASMGANVVTPYNTWLLSHGLPANQNWQYDDNGDGVGNLMAFALGLNPNQNLSGAMPKPIFSSTQMSLSFYSGAPGVTYSVESCTDFTDWSADEVVLSQPDANQIRTATVMTSGLNRFMRLKVNP